MFSIPKHRKIQVLFYNEKLGSGQVLTDLVHEEPTLNVPAADMLALQLGKKIRGTLHDIYTIPRFETPEDIYLFIAQEERLQSKEASKTPKEWYQKNSENIDYKGQISRDLCLAYNIATQYLRYEEYYLPSISHIQPRSIKDLMKIIKTGQNYRSIGDKIAYCTILKEVLGIFRIIRYPGFKVNYETGFIDVRNKEFIREIIEVFQKPPFQYSKDGDKKFSETSTEMQGGAIVDGKYVELYASFNVKSLYPMIEKMDGQDKYGLPEAFKDIHRMRIEVRDPEDAVRIARILYQSLGGGLKIDNVGGIIPLEMHREYRDSFLMHENEEGYREALESAMLHTKNKEKAYSEDRQELKLTRGGKKPVEIQIVLVNNNNETGYAHHDVYKIRRKIVAKIRRHGWIGTKGIRTIISMVFRKNAENNKGKCSIPFTEEQIYKHLLEIPEFLIGVRGATERVNSERNRKGEIKINYYTTKEVVQKYQQNYPDATKRDPISLLTKDPNIGGEMLTPISEIAFPSNS